MRSDAVKLKNLIEHLAMLAGDDVNGLNLGLSLESLENRRHLDGFRARPEDAHNFDSLPAHVTGCTPRGGPEPAVK